MSDSVPDGFFIDQNGNEVPVEVKYGYRNHQNSTEYHNQLVKHMSGCNSVNCLVISVRGCDGEIKLLLYTHIISRGRILGVTIENHILTPAGILVNEQPQYFCYTKNSNSNLYRCKS